MFNTQSSSVNTEHRPQDSHITSSQSSDTVFNTSPITVGVIIRSQGSNSGVESAPPLAGMLGSVGAVTTVMDTAFRASPITVGVNVGSQGTNSGGEPAPLLAGVLGSVGAVITATVTVTIVAVIVVIRRKKGATNTDHPQQTRWVLNS